MTYWITAAVASARVEVGRDCHGFYRGFATETSRAMIPFG
jgi:hypothetical protein